MGKPALLIATLTAVVLGACTGMPGTPSARPEVQRLLDEADAARKVSETSVTELLSGSDVQAMIRAAVPSPLTPIPTTAPSGQTVTWRQAVDNGNGTVTVSSGSIGRLFPTYRDSSIVVTVEKGQPERVLQFKTVRSVSEDYPAGERISHERVGAADGYRETLSLSRSAYDLAKQAGTSYAVELLAIKESAGTAERRAWLLTLPGGEKVSLTAP